MSTTARISFSRFHASVEREFMSHPVILNNEYTHWFSEADLTLEDVRRLTVEFSVFSNFFLVAQLKKMINANNLEEMRASKEILANEIGAVYRPRHSADGNGNGNGNGNTGADTTDVTVDGGVFKFNAAHFEWLLNFARPLGLEFQDLGKRKHGSPGTLHFCDELDRLYGSEDFNTGAGASFAVENWAAAGFWKELIKGLENFKSQKLPELNISFFTYHDRLEDSHAEHTLKELKQVFELKEFKADVFIQAGLEMLEGVAAFWKGLNQDRLKRFAG